MSKDASATKLCEYCESEPALEISDEGRQIGERCLPWVLKHEERNA